MRREQFGYTQSCGRAMRAERGVGNGPIHDIHVFGQRIVLSAQLFVLRRIQVRRALDGREVLSISHSTLPHGLSS
jgi:hypothetical protein